MKVLFPNKNSKKEKIIEEVAEGLMRKNLRDMLGFKWNKEHFKYFYSRFFRF
jgi:hypothetical protein